jgi:predicted secreted hydrolase
MGMPYYDAPLLNNLKKPPNGVMPLINAQSDFNYKTEYNVNSWFSIGHIEDKGHRLSFLTHLMIYCMPGLPPFLNSCFSVTDETTGWYQSEDKKTPLNEATISKSAFSIAAPNVKMWGSLEQLCIQASMKSVELNIVMNPVGHVIYNGGAGQFSMLGMTINQYSLPTLKTTGTLTINDAVYDAAGISWFDRQWEMKSGDLNGRWSWMDINLDCGDAISLWGYVDASAGDEHAWATILHSDGTQSVVTIEPLSKGESEYWISSNTKRKYPTHWVVKIPIFDAVLEVVPFPKEQEIVSEFPMLHKYEGASSVTGTYRGKKVSGYCYVELVARWIDY